MPRALVAHLLVIAALASCATVSGLADKETVECPGGCAEGGLTPTPTSTSTTDGSTPIVDSGPPPPDAEPNFTKPDGWELVAVATVVGAAKAPDCPPGFADVSDIGTSPTATANTCECASCNVAQPATCTGNPALVNGDGVCDNVVTTTPTGPYSNDPAGGCNTDLFAGSDRTGQYVKVKLAPAMGGTCTASAATPHPERVQFIEKRRVCDETARCNGNLCDATVPAPFSACVASAKGSGNQPCPAGFPQQLVAGRANVTCGANSCSCTVTRTPCAGTFTYYKDTGCLTGAAGAVADDTCRNLNASGTYAAYKIAATTTTGCTAGGTSAAAVTPADVRTVCCR